MICHFLIGPPGSGKSTLAEQLATIEPSQIVSTDAIRASLYGDETIQGNWQEIEAEVLRQIQEALSQNQPVIYDATNYKRTRRIEFLEKIDTNPEIKWIAWMLKTPLETCQRWNQKRERKVANEIIEAMIQGLKDFPPLPAEGFATVYTLTPGDSNRETVREKLSSFARGQINRKNRTKNRRTAFHNYSKLVDFDRLLLLLSLIIHYPNLGQLAPNQLEEIFGEVPEFEDSLAEISAVMAKCWGEIYSDQEALAKDLEWLQENYLIGVDGIVATRDLPEIQVTPVDDPSIIAHAYSNTDPFKRLLTTIRHILHVPFQQDTGGGYLYTLADAVAQSLGYKTHYRDRLRKDIENVLKPYRIMPPFRLRHGYFAGTGILTAQELKQVYSVLQRQADSLEDPQELAAYETLKSRLALSKQGAEDTYPIRALAYRSQLDRASLHPSVLSHQLESLESYIDQSSLLQVKRIDESEGETDYFSVWPLQLVFYNFSWYLGYECEGGTQPKLLQFEALDRLVLGKPTGQVRERKIQKRSLNKLQTLLEASAGIYLGDSVEEQQQYLSKAKVHEVETTVELWFNDSMFRLLSEGTHRYSFKQIKMSPAIDPALVTKPEAIFSLSNTDDPQFPNCFQITLPKWSLDDVDFLRWILGFGAQAKVAEPQSLVDKIKAISTEITELY